MSKRTPILLGILLVFIALWMLVTPDKFIHGLIERLDNLGYDLQLRTHVLTGTLKPAPQVAIIDIDDNSLKAEGHWPWPRSKLAALVNELNKQGAAVIAFDIFFSEQEKNIANVVITELNKHNVLDPALTQLIEKNSALFDEDAIFAKSLTDVQSVLPVTFLPREETYNILPAGILTLTKTEMSQLDIVNSPGYISNIPVLQQAAKQTGFINIFPDSDGIIRRAPLIMRHDNNVYAALSLQAVLSFLGENITLDNQIYHESLRLEGVNLGEATIPTDEKGMVLIPFIGKSYTFPYYSATDVLHGKIPKDALLGKILFVGTSATGLGDLKATAIQNPFPGVEVQATIASGILQHNFSHIPAWAFGANFVLTLFLGLLAAFIFPYLGPRTLGIIIVFIPIILLLINNWMWQKTGIILSLLMPVALVMVSALLNILYGYLFETRKREQLKEMFGQYVPAKHIDEMLHSSGSFALRGEDRDMSVLFADIRSFTTISEGMTAADLVDMLNTFFTPMTETIFKHRGTIDKYVGDMIMSFWGAPLKDKHHARHAIESALEMQAKVKSMRPMLAEHNWPEINIGIGINSGKMSVGDMGSKYRLNYTVLGDEVNLASRVESLTKFYGVDIIVTEHTQHHQTKFVFRELDRVRVKGKKKGIIIYEPICLATEQTEELKQELEQYHLALNAYFQQKWGESYQIMLQLHEKYPDKKIYSLYIERISEFKTNPPPADWDGIYVHKSK